MERAAFPSSPSTLATFHSSLANVANLGANDIYAWYLANLSPIASAPDLKLNLVYPCTEAHIKKYSPQTVRVVTETPEIYVKYVRPYMQRKRKNGRLDWVYNITEGRKEQEDIILRDSRDLGRDLEGFLLLPDMNWDRKTKASLRILGLVERHDLWSLRDLKKSDVEWLKRVQNKIAEAVESMYGVEKDLLKLYVHCMLSLISVLFSYLIVFENCLAKGIASRPANLLPFSYPHHIYAARAFRYPGCPQSLFTS